MSVVVEPEVPDSVKAPCRLRLAPKVQLRSTATVSSVKPRLITLRASTLELTT